MRGGQHVRRRDRVERVLATRAWLAREGHDIGKPDHATLSLAVTTHYAPGGAVAAAHHLAAAAGVGMLDRGGNAADAAIAAGTVMAVVAPHMCGLGGDL